MADNNNIEEQEPQERLEEHYINNEDGSGGVTHPVSMMLYYEACMRNHAAAYANAAAGAACAAAHAAAAYYNHANVTTGIPMHSSGPPPMATYFPITPYPPPFVLPMPVPTPNISLPSPIPSPQQHHNNNKHEYRSKRERTRFSGRRRVRSDNDSSSSGGGNSWRRPSKKATSLIGKTGVSVLFEWASKRQITPTLTLQQDAKSFECIVYLPDSGDKDLLKEWGRAKGSNKAVAKQEAARNALKALLPGIVFDEETGQLQALPKEESNPDAPTSLIDELPNLARRLVIEHPKRARETTESDDSESAFNFKEGANVCSQLLHSLVQIDPQRLLSFPVFTYELADAAGARRTFACKGLLKTNDGTIEASCVSGTKRQARHTVSALLLAKLFPECSTMSEVKAAAEARKEEFTRRKKQQYHRDFASKSAEPIALDTRLWTKSSDPPLPKRMQHEIRTVLGMVSNPEEDFGDREDFLNNDDSILDDSPSSAFQKLSRQRQLISMLQASLLKFNDQDEDGRSLPEEITDNDVGRTVLRLADPQDLTFIKHLCQSQDEEQTLTTEKLALLWSLPSCFCLLLCRAIAAYEDPPLGCAVLTIGFSGSRRILRISVLASESHLPHERFIECLRGFATAMDSDLKFNENDDSEKVNGPALLRSYVNKRKQNKKSMFSSQLQSVREESAEESAEERCDVRRATKPSKRSRVV